LITSRAHTLESLGLPKPVKLAVMTSDEAIDFLSKRTGRNFSDQEEEKAAIKLSILVKLLG
jgi:hypothetical protein